MKELFSIGYQGYPGVDFFINDLKYFGVKMLVDVRSVPYSKYYSDWNKEMLERRLQIEGIQYLNMKNEFGARQTNPKYFRNGRMDFELFSESVQFMKGIEFVENIDKTICLMCMEKLPSMCHRSILVGRAFRERGCSVKHIISGRKVVNQFDIELKLVKTYFGIVDMNTNFISAAYELRNNEIGWKK